jgi:hypothetical protein
MSRRGVGPKSSPMLHVGVVPDLFGRGRTARQSLALQTSIYIKWIALLWRARLRRAVCFRMGNQPTPAFGHPSQEGTLGEWSMPQKISCA